MPSLTVLVTGGAGYVGSHTILELLNAGHNVVCVDNLCNAYCEEGAALPEALKRVQLITGKKIHFYLVDIRDGDALLDVFKKVRMLTNQTNFENNCEMSYDSLMTLLMSYSKEEKNSRFSLDHFRFI